MVVSEAGAVVLEGESGVDAVGVELVEAGCDMARAEAVVALGRAGDSRMRRRNTRRQRGGWTCSLLQ